MFRLQAQAKGIDFRFAAANLPDVVATDEKRLRQILINLLSNAIKFTDKGTSISGSATASRWPNSRSDTGIGIDAEDLERIFGPFERARSARAKATRHRPRPDHHPAATQAMGGEITGAQHAGERQDLHGEDVAVGGRSTADGAGSRTPFSAIGARDNACSWLTTRVQHDLIAMCWRRSASIVLAAGGAGCLALVKTHRPEPVPAGYIDAGHGRMEGGEPLRQPLTERPAIVMVSAIALDKSTRWPERLHDGYLMKPVDFRQLLEKIRTLLKLEWQYEANRIVVPPSSAAGIAAAGKAGGRTHRAWADGLHPRHPGQAGRNRDSIIPNAEMTSFRKCNSDRPLRPRSVHAATLKPIQPAQLNPKSATSRSSSMIRRKRCGMLTDALDDAGMTVMVAMDGAAAMRIVDQITPDIILLDAVMPGMDGFETCRRLKRDAGLSNVPVIFMTGLAETGTSFAASKPAASIT